MTKPNRDTGFLYPPFALLVRTEEADWNSKNPATPMGLFEGYRSFERQAELYAVGRTVEGAPCSHPKPCKLHPLGLRITNAPPGLSWHNYGLGADKVFDADPVKPDSQFSWDGKFPWPKFAKHAEEFGLESAAFWKSFPEFPHIQQPFGIQIQEAFELHSIGGLDAVWKALDLTRQARVFREYIPA